MIESPTVATLYPHRMESGASLHMSSAMLRELGLHVGTQVTLCLLFRRITVRVAALPGGPIEGDGAPPRVYVPSNIMRLLGLPAGWTVMLRRGPTSELHVGPFIGIFCQRYPVGPIYGPQTAFFRRLITIGRSMNMCVYIFEAGDVDRTRGTVNGMTWISDRGWVRRRFPLPHVLYDRGLVNGRVMRLQHWLRHRGVEQFNSWVGSKLWVYRQIARVPELAALIPETVVLRRTADLASMLRRHGTVYVKAAGGGKGIGIWVVSLDAGGNFAYRYTDAHCRIRRGRTNDLSAIVHLLRSRPRQPWLIQPRIDLLRYRGRIFDVRVLVQRDGRGALHVTGSGARIGRRGSIISNIFGGGDARALEPLLEESLGLSPLEAVEMRRRIEQIALDVAELIHRACRRTGHVGELGIDIGIDRRGRLWFFEANSRTGRNVFQLAGMQESARRALRRPMEFALYLSGFSPGPTAAAASS